MKLITYVYSVFLVFPLISKNILKEKERPVSHQVAIEATKDTSNNLKGTRTRYIIKKGATRFKPTPSVVFSTE